jgi:RIO-like serine/threonine protein kinase
MFESLKLCELPKKQCGILREASNTRPTIWVVEEDGVRAVVKDFSTNKFLFRNTVGRFIVWRERRAYRKLKNLKGVPNLHRVVDGLALVIEEIPASNLEDLEDKVEIPETFYDALEDLVARLHERGMAHCDLKRAPNILFGHDGLPYIIDWGASIDKKEFSFFPLNSIYQRLLLDDNMAIIKLKIRHTPEAVTLEERWRYNRSNGRERLLRSVRDRLRGLLQKIA